MKKELYQAPEMELDLFEVEDVITASGSGSCDDIDDEPCSHSHSHR